MHEFFAGYDGTLFVVGATGALLLVQLVVADVTGIRSGHAPGSDVESNPKSFFFRATRAHANTNESVAAFLLLALFAIGAGASPTWTDGFAVTYLAGRIGHMACYYAGLSIPRSACFGLAAIGLVGLAVTGFRAALA